MTGGDEREDKLLGAMMGYVMNGQDTVSFKQLSDDLGFMDRTKSWRSSWKTLLEVNHFIEVVGDDGGVFTGECRLTKSGKDHATTPEYVEYLKELNFVPKNNTEHQARIKKRLLNDNGVAIFDLLLKYGSISRKDLSSLLRCNDRSHKFSYGLKDLKTKGLVEDDPASSNVGTKKIRLTDKAFTTAEGRPTTVELEPELVAEGAKVVKSKKRSVRNTNDDDQESMKTSSTSNKKESSTKKKKTKLTTKLPDLSACDENDQD